MIDNEIKNKKNDKNQPLINLSSFDINVLIIYFISILIAIISEKNTKYIIICIIITMVIFYIRNLLKSEKPTFDFVVFVGLGIFLIPLITFGFFMSIDKIFQTKELRIKENKQYGIEYIKDYIKYDYKYKIYIDSTKEIKEISEIDFYSLKFSNCQSIKIITEYYDIKSIFLNDKNISGKEKQETYLKDDIVSEKIICEEKD